MNPTTTLLVSTDPTLILDVEHAHEACTAARLEVSGRHDRACTLVGRNDIVLVLIQITAQVDRTSLERLLRTCPANPRATRAILSRDAQTLQEIRTALPDIDVETFSLPAEREKLDRLVSVAHQQPPRALERNDDAKPVALPETNGVSPSLAFLKTYEQLNQVRRVAAQDTTILLTGESGTGKSLLARAVHECSPRQWAPYLVVDCGVLASNLIESEMFGHAKGAFTGAERERVGKFAAVGDGTLVLDEINSLPLPLQCKLLRAVEERVFEPVGSNKSQPLKARLIAISNVPLEREVAQGRFRPDLYFRLNVVQFHMPPLRERRHEISALAHELLEEFTAGRAAVVTGFASETLRAMEAHQWPGNIRELRNVVERAVALGAGPLIEPGDLPETMRDPDVGRAGSTSAFVARYHHVANGDDRPPEDELQRICAALRKHRNNRLRTAAELGISRVSLYKKLNKYGIEKKIK